MSYLLPHLRTGWSVDQAIINEEERVVCLRFGHDHDVTCMQMDEVLAGIAEDVKNFCAIYVVDVSEVNTRTLSRQHWVQLILGRPMLHRYRSTDVTLYAVDAELFLKLVSLKKLVSQANLRGRIIRSWRCLSSALLLRAGTRRGTAVLVPGIRLGPAALRVELQVDSSSSRGLQRLQQQ